VPNIHSPSGSEGYSRRRRRGTRVSTSLSEINVVPLVDVMLVMLIIFMVAAPMMQRGLDVNLPEARRADAISAERLFVTVPLSFRADGLLQVDEDTVLFDALHERIALEMEARTERNVFLRGDAGIRYGELMQVMDKLKEGGVEEVGLVVDFPSDTP